MTSGSQQFVRWPQWIAAVLLLSVACQDETTSPPGDDVEQPVAPVPTPVGTPTGAVASATIGSAGGSLASHDGALTLTVPAGAVSAGTEITIQPITNHAWGGIGTAYRLLPDGLTFSQPVSLSFRADPTKLGTSAEFLHVATQEADGNWYTLKTSSFNLTTGTFTAQTTHFTDFTLVAGLQLVPGNAFVKRGEAVTLQVIYCATGSGPGTGNPNVRYLITQCTSSTQNQYSNWSVNGVVGGTPSFGTVAPNGATTNSAMYIAPGIAPNPNPVHVSVNVTSAARTTLLVATIQVGWGVWEGTATVWASAGTANPKDRHRFDFNLLWIDEGEFGPIATFFPTGMVTARIWSDPNCPGISLVPNTFDMVKFGKLFENGLMIIGDPTAPPGPITNGSPVSVNLYVYWDAFYTYQCNDGSPRETVPYRVVAGIPNAVGLFNADMTTITGAATDPDSGDEYQFTFTRPP